jgi:hypothetical protein
MADNDISPLPPRPWKARESGRPADLFDEGPNQAEVLRDLAGYLAVFLTIALAPSLLVRLLASG